MFKDKYFVRGPYGGWVEISDKTAQKLLKVVAWEQDENDEHMFYALYADDFKF